MFDRRDEAGFRERVPRIVAGRFEVLEVRAFRAGSTQRGRYATATVITRQLADEARPYAVHTLVFADDRLEGDPERWYLTNGHYTDTRERADRVGDARARDW